MKNFKKMLALLVVVVLALSLSTTAIAAGPKTADGSVTVSGVESGDTVNLYQVVQWVTNDGWTFVAPYDTGLSAAQKTDVLAGNINSQLAETIAELATTAAYTNSDATASRTISVNPGLYLVLVTPANSGVIYNPAFVASDYEGTNNTNQINMSTAGYDSETIMKKQPITVSKTVDNAKTTDDYSIGDTLSFAITTTIPRYPANSTYASLTISDAPSGLTIVPSTLVVKVDNVVVYNANTNMPSTTGTVTATTTAIEVDFVKAYILANGGKSVEVTYSAVLTSVDAVDGTAENDATVKYNPNPFVSTQNEVDDIDEIKTYGLVFEKVDEDHEALAGAVFDLYDANGNKITDAQGNFLTVTTTIVNGHAYVYWSGLKAGTYTVKETTAPAGYNQVADFTITVGETTATADNPATADVTETNYNANFTGTDAVVDTEGTVLPSTGGIGTTIFYVLGAVLMLGAGVVLVTRRRMDVQ